MQTSKIQQWVLKPNIRTIVILLAIFLQASTQPTALNNVHIESKKFAVFQGKEKKTKISQQKKDYQIPYARVFTRKPDVGQSVYSLQLDYNIEFSMSVNQEASTTDTLWFYVSGKPSRLNFYDQLYIMYIASDYDQLGIYMPGPKNTTKLSTHQGSPNRSQQLTYNFKNIGTEPIFSSSTNVANIRVSVYLTGIVAESQTQQIGYSRNYTYFSLTVPTKNTRFYTVQVTVRSSSGDVIINIIEFTVVYFDVTKIAAQYQMDSNNVLAANFGGTFYRSSFSLPLDSLPQNSSYENTLQYFFGINEIQCTEGLSINLLAVQRFNYNNNGKLQNLVLTFQTQVYTYIKRGGYNYIQYKPKTCNDSAVCGIPCGDPNQPSYRITNLQNRCAPCLYFCNSCTNGFNCTTCPATRVLAAGAICSCVSNSLYDDQFSRECQNCFDASFCFTCTRKGVCQTCFDGYNFTYNNVLRTCQCSAGTYSTVGNGQNMTGLINQASFICKVCSPNCIYCRSQIQCLACTVPTYLASQPRQISGTVQACTPICPSNTTFNQNMRQCDIYLGDQNLFDADGRLGFDWDYKTQNNQMIVDLLFSQSNMTYYFYQNGKGYQYVTTQTDQTTRNNAGESNVYHDDGNGFISGYDGGGVNAFASSITDTKITTTTENYMFDESALRGQYYGMGQAKFYKERYSQISPKAQYLDQFEIPFGKHQLNSTTISDSATFLDAIRNNLDFQINGQSMPYTIKALSGNHLQLVVRPETSYLTSNASITFKNPALVRSNQTALQTPTVSKQIDRLDYYTQNQLLTASSLRDRTSTIVQILWGICKYILFAGFGWCVMPLMLVLQYIFGHNYISAQLPLNLEYFLNSFADFRNPSILFNPQRNDFDRQVVNHDEIYKRVGAFEQFDRGIDFMKNSFQFFFTPLLSFAGQFLLIGINFLINKVCKWDIPIISQYLQPRLGHHAAAYTLVQALPISFFFFGQLQDTRYNHVNSPNSVYPSFNTGMSYASFFASAIIPLVLLTGIYNYFKNKFRSGNFNFDKVKGDDQPNKLSNDPAMIADPLWGGNPSKPLSYGFGAAVFYLPLVVGFFLSFFSKTYPWQLTGLLLSTLGLTAFAAASKHFLSKIPKFFFVGIGLLMLAYQLVHAGIGSNRALSTYDQWNTGYLGIGLIYALILTAIIFSGYLIYKLLTNLYENFIKPKGCLTKLIPLQQKIKAPEEENLNRRDTYLGRNQRRNTTKMKSYIDNQQHSSDRFLNNNGKNQRILDNLAGGMTDTGLNYRQNLEYIGPGTAGKSMFKAMNSGKQYQFPAWASKELFTNSPLQIDSNQFIFSKNSRKQLGSVPYFLQQQQTSSKNLISTRGLQPKNSTDKTIQMYDMGNLPKQSSKNLKNALDIYMNNNLGGGQSSKYINVGGKSYQFEQTDNNLIKILNFDRNRAMELRDFFDIFIANKNKLTYEGKQYLLQRNKYNSPKGGYLLVDPNSGETKYQISQDQIWNLVNYRPSSNNQNNYNVVSTSLLPSHKQLSQQDYVQLNAAKSNQSIVFTKDTQQFLIKGVAYNKENQDDVFLYLVNPQNGRKLQVKKSDFKIKQTLIKERQGSLRQIIDKKLEEQQQTIFYQGDQYYFKKYQNQRYVFTNASQRNTIRLTQQQLAQLFGYKYNAIASNKSVSQDLVQFYIPPGATTMRLINTDISKGVHAYKNPITEEEYQMPIEWIDVNTPVYIDKDQNIWHKGEILGSESQVTQNENVLNSQQFFSVPQQSQQQVQQQIQQNIQRQISQQSINQYQLSQPQQQMVQNAQLTKNQYLPMSNNSLPSNTSLSFEQGIKDNQYYNIKFLSPDYKYVQGGFPSAKDIEQIKENVLGRNVLTEIQLMKSINPYGKILIQNTRNQSQKFLLN